MSEIARGSGIQKASIYYHYTSKEALLFSILETTMNDLTSYLHHNLTGLRNVEEKMRVAVHSHVRFHLERQKETLCK
jgi:Transcriptional regulator